VLVTWLLWLLFHSENKGKMFFRKIGELIPDLMESFPEGSSHHSHHSDEGILRYLM
jgi:hypothetical protein